MRVSRFIVLGLLLLAIIAGACSRTGDSPSERLGGPGATPGGINDTTPNPPPPPPPPPPPAVRPVVLVYVDTLAAGSAGTARFRVTNESSAAFTMQWYTRGGSGWPGFPMTGSVSLQGDEVRDLDLTIAVPDTAVAGPRWLEMHVSRPNGLGEGYENATVLVVP